MSRNASSSGSPAAVVALFSVNGVVLASAASRVPQLRAQVGATPTELAFALVCIGIGSLAAMPFTGRLVNRFSSGRVCRTSFLIMLTGWALAPLATSVPALAGILLFTGVGVGSGDVSMNIQANLVEQRRRQVLMQNFHGTFSAASVIGALTGAAAARAGVPLGWQLPIVSLVLVIPVVFGTSGFIDDAGLHPAGEPAPREPGLRRLTRAIANSPITTTEMLLGIVLFATAVGEGAANDWLALVLVDDRGAPAALGALVYAGFNVTMSIGRFAGGAVITRFGRVAVLRVAGLLASSGVLVLCLVPSTVAALFAAAAWGLGLSVVFPSAISASGEIPGRGGRAIAVTSTLGYTGFLLGAPLIGLLAHLMPLDRALLAVAALVLLVVALAPVARESQARPVSPGADSEPTSERQTSL